MNRLKLSLSILALMMTSPAFAESTRLVLAVGQNQGLHSEVPLRYAHADARGYVRLLQSQGGVAPRHTIVLTETTPKGLDEGFGASESSRRRPLAMWCFSFITQATATANRCT